MAAPSDAFSAVRPAASISCLVVEARHKGGYTTGSIIERDMVRAEDTQNRTFESRTARVLSLTHQGVDVSELESIIK